MRGRTFLTIAAFGCGMLASSHAEARPKRKPRHSKVKKQARRGPTVRDHRGQTTPQPAPTIQVEAQVGPQVSTHSTERVRVHSVSSREVRYAPEPEPDTPPPSATLSNEPNRLWHLGVNLGTGSTIANVSSIGLSGSMDAYAGLRISSFALQGEGWLQFRDYFSVGDGLVQSMALLTAQLWLDENVWIKAGVGGAYLQEDGDPTVAHGTALMGGVGYDFVDTRHVVLNLHAKAGTGLYRERGIYSTFSAGVGFTWY